MNAEQPDNGSVSNEPLSSLEPSERLTRLIELERSQLGSEIHDGLLPLVFAASASVSGLLRESDQGNDLHERLQQVADWLDQALVTGRQLLTQVYPPELSETTWIAAAHDAIHRSCDTQTTTIEWGVAESLHALPPAIALTAYRIVVEATRNATKHGRASRIAINGQQDEGIVTLVIQDDGCGFDENRTAKDRFGIRAMRARAELVGGTLTIASQPDAGTKVTCELPWSEATDSSELGNPKL